MAQPKKRKLFAMNPIIVVLGLVSLFTDLSSNMIVPILPLYLTSVYYEQLSPRILVIRYSRDSGGCSYHLSLKRKGAYAFTEGIQKAYIADIVPEGLRGTAMGTYNALIGLAALPASIIAGFLWQTFGPVVAFSTSSIIAILAALLMIVFRV